MGEVDGGVCGDLDRAGGTVAAVTRLGAARKKSRTVALERRVDPMQPTRNEKLYETKATGYCAKGADARGP